MTAGWAWAHDESAEGGRGAQSRFGRDGEIKGPGPFGSKALLVLKKFRDHQFAHGPATSRFVRIFKGLSGTSRSGGPNV